MAKKTPLKDSLSIRVARAHKATEGHRIFRMIGEEIVTQRGEATPNVVDDAIANLLDHYEKWGLLMSKMLAEVAADPT